MEERFTCDWIFSILVVLCDGKVVCGCADPRGERPLGHLREKTLHEIWNSEKVKGIRTGLNRGHASFCLNCGLKRRLGPQDEIPQRPVHLEVLPRIFFEPTIACNLSCFKSVCSKESGIIHTRERTFFPFNEFESMMEEIGSQLDRLDFFNYGESFVHPEAVDMLEHIKKKYPHIYIYISTNGLLFNTEKSERLVQSAVDEITFSVDGADQKTYAAYRRGGDLGKVLENMAVLIQARNKTGREVPYINWRYILFKWNDSPRKMRAARKLAEKIGVDRLTWEITNHPKEAISKKYQFETRDWKRIRHEIWDTSQINNVLKSKRHSARIRIAQKVIETLTDQPTFVETIVANTGGARWLASSFSGRRLVRLGVQLYDKHKKLIDLNYARAFLPHDVVHKTKVRLTIELPPLQSPGDYWLKFDMVSEGIDWFESAGSQVLWKKFVIMDAT